MIKYIKYFIVNNTIKKYKSLKNNRERFIETKRFRRNSLFINSNFWRNLKNGKNEKKKVVFANVSETTLRN